MSILNNTQLFSRLPQALFSKGSHTLVYTLDIAVSLFRCNFFLTTANYFLTL